MKKKWLTGIIILTQAVSLTACGETAKTTETSDSGSTNSTQEVSSNYDNSTLEGIREGIESDFSDTIQKINEKLEETNSAVGNSYEEYITNKQLVTDWYTFAISEENALFERTVERSVEYYKLIAASIDLQIIMQETMLWKHFMMIFMMIRWTISMTKSTMMLWMMYTTPTMME